MCDGAKGRDLQAPTEDSTIRSVHEGDAREDRRETEGGLREIGQKLNCYVVWNYTYMDYARRRWVIKSNEWEASENEWRIY